jgi:hypothetical protein
MFKPLFEVDDTYLEAPSIQKGSALLENIFRACKIAAFARQDTDAP